MKGKHLYLQIKIKKVGIKYLNHCIKLDQQTLNGIWTERQWQEELSSQKRICLGALQERKLVGVTSGWLSPDELNITFVGVNPLYQNQGIATLLLLSLLQHCWKIGISIATLEVKEKNLAAKALYKKLDFHQIGFRYKLYKDGSNAVIYQYIYN